jgi:hypothetical protein
MRVLDCLLLQAGRHDEAATEMADVAVRQAATQGASHSDTLQAERILSSMRSNEKARFGFLPRAD